MTGLEVVGLWSSIVVGLIGGTLAVIAMLFTRSVDRQNNELHQRFTETLTSINEKSAYTQEKINSMVGRVVDTFLEVRSAGLSRIERIEGNESEEGVAGPPALLEEISRISRAIDENPALAVTRRTQHVFYGVSALLSFALSRLSHICTQYWGNFSVDNIWTAK